MDKDTVNNVVENLFFSKEAAEYLGITVQRLYQLVNSGQIVPVKKSSAGTLFLKSDLDNRNENVKNIATEIESEISHDKIDLDSPFMNEVLNYYTIQSFYNYTDKKAVKTFKYLSQIIDVTKSIKHISKGIASYLKVTENEILKNFDHILESFKKLNNSTDYIIKFGMKEYPKLLSITEEAPPYLFLRGNISLLNEKIVSVVGSRDASKEGSDKAYRLSHYLGKSGIVVASGLARGIDSAAHKAALDFNNSTIAVIGTPITQVYPKENEDLQKKIGEVGLIVSQFPPSAPVQRWYFPMRNAIMSGISLATVIVEAGETSGALKQADYALKQNRLVFIPQSALDNNNITWPKRYILRDGAAKFSKLGELLVKLEEAKIIPNPVQMNIFSEGVENVHIHRFE